MTVLVDPAPRSDGLRVLVATNVYPSPWNPSIGMFVADQVIALRQRTDVGRVDVLYINGLAATRNYALGLVQLNLAVRRRPYDLIHAHWGLTGALAVMQRRLPVVITFHGGDLAYKRWHRLISRAAARRSGLNICVSRDGLTLLGQPATHIACGVDTELFVPRDRPAARRTFHVPEGALAVLFPSAPWRQVKRHDRFLAALAEMERRGATTHELRLDGVARDQVPELMAAADVMLLTSESEGSPVAVMEALSCGLPVVATPVGDLPAMVDGEPSVVLAPFDAARFAELGLTVANAAARTPSPLAEHFGQAAVVDRLLEAYRGVLGTQLFDPQHPDGRTSG